MKFEWDEEKRLSNLLLSTQSAKNLSALFLQEKQQIMSSDPTLNKSQTDWQRLDAMRNEEIDLSDCPEVTPAQFAKAVVHKQESTSVKVDRDVLEWFKLHNQDYQTEINQLLRSYMESHRP